jgi:predicted RNA methylase
VSAVGRDNKEKSVRVDDDVLAVLSSAIVDGSALTLTGQLDRKMYEKVNKILDACGGKWNRKAKAHLFDGDAGSRIDEVILSGQVEVPKDEFNYFPSPPSVVARIMEIAAIQSGMRVLEPSAGQGAIAMEVAKITPPDCYELMESNFSKLASTKGLGGIWNKDFLTAEPEAIYDRVVMNPPFIKQNDIKHVLHALKFLKPDGLLVSVMSAGVLFRTNRLTEDFRALVDARGGFIEQMEEGSFKASGTMVRTVIVVLPGDAPK